MLDKKKFNSLIVDDALIDILDARLCKLVAQNNELKKIISEQNNLIDYLDVKLYSKSVINNELLKTTREQDVIIDKLDLKISLLKSI